MYNQWCLLILLCLALLNMKFRFFKCVKKLCFSSLPLIWKSTEGDRGLGDRLRIRSQQSCLTPPVPTVLKPVLWQHNQALLLTGSVFIYQTSDYDHKGGEEKINGPIPNWEILTATPMVTLTPGKCAIDIHWLLTVCEPQDTGELSRKTFQAAPCLSQATVNVLLY